ncbi:hypothetical protein M2139_002659 [Enterococcus sp. PF1-24]|nr:hypothetical protein [Enterococcus sp. PFB1-1]MDH6402753.1 hypothetical protein [Enterococcus sp. PF1-24]
MEAENYGSTYTDNESRIKALATEETALLELLQKSDKMEDMLKIQERLSIIRAEREQLVGLNQKIDNQVDYVAVEVTIDEVDDVLKNQASASLIKRIQANLTKQGQFWQEKAADLFVFLVSNDIYLLLLILAVLLG